MQSVSSYREQREEVVDALQLLFRSGVMSHSGHANFSCRVDAHLAVLAAGPIVRDVTVDDLVVVSLNGGTDAPDGCAPDVVDMHVAVYRARPEAGAVVHTHSPAVTAFALANRPLPCRYETLHRFGAQVGDVPLAPWTPGRRDQSFLSGIHDALTAQPGTRAVLLANHGVLALASTPGDAALLLIALEEAAEAEIAAADLGGARNFPVSAATPGRDRPHAPGT